MHLNLIELIEMLHKEYLSERGWKGNYQITPTNDSYQIYIAPDSEVTYNENEQGDIFMMIDNEVVLTFTADETS